MFAEAAHTLLMYLFSDVRLWANLGPSIQCPRMLLKTVSNKSRELKMAEGIIYPLQTCLFDLVF